MPEILLYQYTITVDKDVEPDPGISVLIAALSLKNDYSFFHVLLMAFPL